MARKCSVCGKGPMSGNKVSHSNIKTRKVGVQIFTKLKIPQQAKVENIFAQDVCVLKEKTLIYNNT